MSDVEDVLGEATRRADVRLECLRLAVAFLGGRNASQGDVTGLAEALHAWVAGPAGSERAPEQSAALAQVDYDALVALLDRALSDASSAGYFEQEDAIAAEAAASRKAFLVALDQFKPGREDISRLVELARGRLAR